MVIKMTIIEKNDPIYVAGHRGLVGSAIVRELKKNNYTNIITATKEELNLLEQEKVHKFFSTTDIDYVFLAAAKVGGINANNIYPADFLYQNLMIQTNVINAAFENKVKKLEFLGSSCIYPKLAPQPLKEDSLLTGPLEPTNEAYAIAKIAGIKLSQYYTKQYGFKAISLMPTNLYGPGDNFDLETSHVLPALIRKFHEAKKENKPFVTLWGTGTPKREFLHVDDLANASVFLMENYEDPEIINVGTGKDLTIKDLALLIKEIVGYEGELKFDSSKPDGTPRKVLNMEKLSKLGWEQKIKLHDGITSVYNWYKKSLDNNKI